MHRLVIGGDGRRVFLAEPQQAVLVLGPPRSGKTSAVVVPNVLATPGPVVSTSTKADVLEATSLIRARRGWCWVYDPTATVAVPAGVTRLRWSPVAGAVKWDGALMTARVMVRASPRAVDHWVERAESLLAPLLHAAAIAGEPMKTVVGWVNRRDGRPAARVLRDVGGVPLDVLGGLLATDVRELSGIWSTAAEVVAAYRSSAALASAEAPNFDPAAFVASTDTVYVCAAGRHQGLVAPLVVGLLEEVRAAAYRARSGREVVFALDEVANIAPLPDLPALVSEGGSQGVLTLACLQDLSQARARWGAAADGFGSLFGATIVLPGIGDARTLQSLSLLCGTHAVRTPAGSHSRHGSSSSWSRSWSTRREPLVEPATVAHGRPGSGLLVGGGRVPSWMPLAPWWRVPAWEPPGRVR